MSNQDLAKTRLEAFEAMLGAVQREYADILSKMDKMKGEGKVKTVTYQQLLGRKMMYQNMLSLYQIHGLLQRENDREMA